MSRVQLFISAVTDEFRSYRDALRDSLERQNISIKVQEQLIATGTDTLDKLDDYIRECDAVIHIAGDLTGEWANAPVVEAIRRRYPDLADHLPFLSESPSLSYTMWEACLAVYHRKVLLIAVPTHGVARDTKFVPDESQKRRQLEHLQRLRNLGRYPEITFKSVDNLIAQIALSTLLDLLAQAGRKRKPIVLPYPSLGPLFKGREEFLERLQESLLRVGDGRATAIVGKALHGLGGVGKTRLAVEYAREREGDYSALLFVTASSSETLRRNLAALCGPQALDLPEQQASEEEVRVAAVLRWFQDTPGWLLILDNIDTKESATAAEGLLGRLSGGHVLLTGRLSSWSGSVEPFELDVLTVEASVEFLLERTKARRRTADDDMAVAATLSVELGQLALALEQAGAYIARHRMAFSEYLEAWRLTRDKVLAWEDDLGRVMQYPRSVAVTWQTSFEQLSEPARRLLNRLAWLAPEPIPESLLDVPIPESGESTDDVRNALADIETYSLVTRSRESPTFTIHRLVQDVARRRLNKDRDQRALTDALTWVSAAFVGNPQDVRSWPVLEPLMTHAQSLVQHADRNGISDPTARLMNNLGQLLYAKALFIQAEPLMRRALDIFEKRYEPEQPHVALCLSNLALLLQATNRLSEAEPLMREALAITEKTLGPDHPDVALRLNNLAALLQATNRLSEAEPMMWRALAVIEKTYGPEHPAVAMHLNNVAQLLQATARLSEAEPLMRRALAISEKSFGPEHPYVAVCLNNLADLLKTTNRLSEAEPLMRRALAIDEKSYGSEHPDVAKCLNNLATFLLVTSRLSEAEPLLRRALAISEKCYGPEHPAVATRLNNLGWLLATTNLLSEAEPLMRRSVVILMKFTRETGHEHPYLQAGFRHYIDLLRAMGKTDAEIQSVINSLGSSHE